MPRRRRPVLTVTAAVFLLGFLSVVAAEAYEHTDDGCDVEVHCILCQWHHGTTFVLAHASLPAPPVSLGRGCEAALQPTPLDGNRLETPSRGPPRLS
jgi:hypothetical protein